MREWELIWLDSLTCPIRSRRHPVFAGERWPARARRRLSAAWRDGCSGSWPRLRARQSRSLPRGGMQRATTAAAPTPWGAAMRTAPARRPCRCRTIARGGGAFQDSATRGDGNEAQQGLPKHGDPESSVVSDSWPPCRQWKPARLQSRRILDERPTGAQGLAQAAWFYAVSLRFRRSLWHQVAVAFGARPRGAQGVPAAWKVGRCALRDRLVVAPRLRSEVVRVPGRYVPDRARLRSCCARRFRGNPPKPALRRRSGCIRRESRAGTAFRIARSGSCVPAGGSRSGSGKQLRSGNGVSCAKLSEGHLFWAEAQRGRDAANQRGQQRRLSLREDK